MSLTSPDHRGGNSPWSWLILSLLVAAVIAGCGPQSVPTPTPLPSPTPAPADPLSLVSPEVKVYLSLVRPVTSDFAILNARQQQSDVLQALVGELDLIDPPPEMVEAHTLLREGYQLLAEGTALLETQPDAALRSEAIFTQDWGERQLWEHRRLVTEFLAQVEQEQGP